MLGGIHAEQESSSSASLKHFSLAVSKMLRASGLGT